jgi:cytochrome c biogenesis protein CcdA
MFSLGMAVTFTLLGAIASLTGSLLGDMGGYWKYILSVVALIMGLQMLGALKFQIPVPPMISIKQRGIGGAFLLGLLFGLASSPCATPMLAVILTYVASQQKILYGISLLFVYALAYSVLIFVVGISTGAAESVLQSKLLQKVSTWAPKISGLIFILAGLLILWQLR